MVDGKGAFVLGVPADDYTHMQVQMLSTEEKTATMQARGMKARMQLYINRQRLQDKPAAAQPARAKSM